MEPTFRVFIIVNRPRHEVFEAVADPKELSSYFTTGGASARLEQGQTVTWDFADFPGAFPVDVTEVVPDEKIVFNWKANEPDTDYEVQVTMNFSEVEAGRTKVEIAEAGWHTTDAGRQASYGNCMPLRRNRATQSRWSIPADTWLLR